MKYLIIFILFTSYSPIKKYDLELNLKEGATYSQSYLSQVLIKQTIENTEQIIKMDIEGGMNFHVKKKLNSSYSIVCVYNKLKMTIQSPMGEITFSSTGDDEGIMTAILKSMIDKEFTLELQKNGKISKIENLDNIFTNALDAFPELTEPQKQQILAQLKKAYGEKAFKGNMEMTFAVFPDKKVGMGDSWENSIKLESGMSGVLKNNFTLAETNDENIIIKGNSTLTTEDKDAYVKVNGYDTRYKLSGTMTSEYKLDPDTYWIIAGSIKQDISGEVEIKDMPDKPDGFIIPMTMTSEMTIGL
ncbi:DUF6263 family protein [Fulvivirga maritima]|uniref:DUF6263 family protein n=1 Tax=Fulvivirga maritima TaxID=2904247 RepID=UPI001F44AB14|nr:DUF6263 family protein [Fulvivirga maritima]UII26538.1 DUF6263 family protein [Fulvivirga maritima]